MRFVFFLREGGWGGVLWGSPMKIHNSSILVPSMGPDYGLPLGAIQTWSSNLLLGVMDPMLSSVVFTWFFWCYLIISECNVNELFIHVILALLSFHHILE